MLKSLGLGEEVTVLVHHGVAVPGQIRCGFACTRSRVRICGEASCGLVADQVVAIFMFADGDIGCGQIEHDSGPGQGG